MKRPRQAFSNHPLKAYAPRTNKERLKDSIDTKKYSRPNIDSFTSNAPEAVFIINSFPYFAFIITIVPLLLLIKTLSLIDASFGFLEAFLSAITLYGLFEIFIAFKSNSYRRKHIKIIISNDGITIDNILYPWQDISGEKLIEEKIGRHIHFYLFFEMKSVYVKYSLSGHKFNTTEIKYLLKVFRSRYEKKIIPINNYFEERYRRLNKKEKEKYILSKYLWSLF